MQPTPNAMVANGALTADSCTGPAWCVAVGSTNGSSGTSALAEAWNGTAWRVLIVPTPPGGTDGALAGVSCSAATACTAVGSYTNGQRVHVPMAERWNGTSWTVQPVPGVAAATYSTLSAVSCGSATSCVAAGYYDIPHLQVRLAESWNGTAWSLQQARNPHGAVRSTLSGVSCVTATRCVAVGNYLSASSDLTLTLAQAWDGHTWKVLATPNPAGSIVNYLNGVSCSSATACTAVGDSIAGARDAAPPVARRAGPLAATLAEVWKDGTWRVQKTPSILALFASFYAVSCRSAAACVAVGNYVGGSGAGVTLAEDWNGKQWAVQSTVSSRNGSTLAGVSCPPSGPCTAVGSHANDAGVSVTLAETGPG